MEYKDFFKGKRITLMGLGLLGRGVGDAKFLAKYAKELTITDLKDKVDLKKSIKKLSSFKNIKFVLGKHRLQDFRNRDLIIKGNGVPLDSPFIKEALKNKIPVHMSTALFAKFFRDDFGGILIGITGTRGKSTVTHLIYEILKGAGRDVFIGGNIKGMSTISLLEKVKKNSIAVLELDSWQLQGFGYLKISPDVAVFTTFFPDHMNYYKNNLNKYFRDKANIFWYQSSRDSLVVGKQALLKMPEKIKSNLIVADSKNVPKDWKLKIPGVHNKLNVSCAVEVAKILGLKRQDIKKGVEAFKAVPGRLEFLTEKRGVKFYNDTNSTTPEASIAGLKAFGNGKNIILICGGADKGLQMKEFIKEIKKSSKKVLLLGGTGTDRIKKEFKELKNTAVFDSLKSAVLDAIKNASSGDVILFSPAFASFGMFTNEYERGEKFNKIVKNI